MAIASSLFDAPPSPALPVASDWVIGTLLGPVATGLCVIAVAFVGLMLITGRFAFRDGLRVVLGCFVLLGAPTIAGGLRYVAYETSSAASASPSEPVISSKPPPEPLPPSDYDPYAGASLRRD